VGERFARRPSRSAYARNASAHYKTAMPIEPRDRDAKPAAGLGNKKDRAESCDGGAMTRGRWSAELPLGMQLAVRRCRIPRPTRKRHEGFCKRKRRCNTPCFGRPVRST
jgi:hypothetical protein